MDGLLLVDKERGKTSHDVVLEVRKKTGERRIGHAGTLDPLATGLLVLGLGRGARLLEFMEDHDKEYVADVRLGVLTDTDDAEGKVVGERPVPSREELARSLRTGEILQRVPDYAAVKVKGRKLYEYARAGEAVPAPERRVTIHEIEILDYAPPVAKIRVRCSKGTYIRAIARDLGGSLDALRRTASGPFRVEEAGKMLPLDAAVSHLPEVRVAAPDAFVHGHTVPMELSAPLVRVYCGAEFLGVGERVADGLKPRKVLRGEP
jgi:tRNA pseudouridine55 synthase